MQELPKAQNKMIPWRQWFGREIKKRRLVMGISQLQLMEHMQTGVRTSLSNYESGRGEPTFLNALRICQRLEIDPVEIPLTSFVAESFTLTNQEPLVKSIKAPRLKRPREHREYKP